MEIKYDSKKFPQTDPKHIEAVNRLFRDLITKRLFVVDPSTDPTTPKVVWMVKIFTQLTIHRVVDLFETLSTAWETSKPSVAFILARAIAENAAAIYDLYNRIETHTKVGEFEAIHKAVIVRLMGGRDEKSPEAIPNILCAIDKANKKYGTFRKTYDFLSEFAHPNCFGMHGLYGKIDKKAVVFHVNSERGINDATLSFILCPLHTSLTIIQDSIRNLESLYPAIWHLSDEQQSHT